MATRPASREDFRVAVVCALLCEYNAVSLLIDEFWDEGGDVYGAAEGDPNVYVTGRIGEMDIVLLRLPGMGKLSAASAAASLRSSYARLEVVLLTGICGGVPRMDGVEIILGDVVLSKSVVQYDFGRQNPGGFVTKDTAEDRLGRPAKSIRNLVAAFETDILRDRLEKRTNGLLQELQRATIHRHQGRYQYPGVIQDRLFQKSYRHKHHLAGQCSICDNSDQICAQSQQLSCGTVGCDDANLVKRQRLEMNREHGRDMKPPTPAIFVGCIGSGDAVIKSDEYRDRIAEEYNILAFEMEGAGIWDDFPCIVVKGICDYADSHKNKKWQDYAAGTAASAMKALLEHYSRTYKKQSNQLSNSVGIDTCAEPRKDIPKRHALISLGRNEGFVGRQPILDQLLQRIPPSKNKDHCQRTVLEGLGGIGKTQLALEAAYQILDQDPDCSVFWVPAIDTVAFENAYRKIGQQLGAKGIDDDTDVKALVKKALEETYKKWLLVIDNADDVELVFGDNSSPGLSSYLPFSHKGSILLTTRNHKVAVKFDQRNIITISEMNSTEAIELFQQGLEPKQLADTKSVRSLLDLLANLPLAIRQASAYMAETGISATKYLGYCHPKNRKKDLIKLLSKNFEDQGRYLSTSNPIATTWLVSFQQILKESPLAIDCLRFACFLGEKDIPKLLLPLEDELKADEAIGTLKSYAFITLREDDSFDIHRLVRLAMRNWIEEQGELQKGITNVIQRLARIFPFPEHENREVWTKYLPHTFIITESQLYCTDKVAEADLLANIGQSHYHLNKFSESEQTYRQALELRMGALGPEDLSTLATMNNLALVLHENGKFEEAENLHRHALELRRIVLGPTDTSTLESINNLGVALISQGKYTEAEKLHRYDLELTEKLLGSEHPSNIDGLNNLGTVLGYQGKFEEAERIYQKALNLADKVLGPEDHSRLNIINNCGVILRRLGRYEEAEKAHRCALELQGKILGLDHPSTLRSADNLAVSLVGQGKYEAAEFQHRYVLELRAKVLGPEHPDTVDSAANLGVALQSQRKYEAAESQHRYALEIREKLLGLEHPDTLDSVDHLGVTLQGQGRYEEAEKKHRYTLERRKRTLGLEHPGTLNSVVNLGASLQSQGRYEEAEQKYRYALGLREKVLGLEHPRTVICRNKLANCLKQKSSRSKQH